MVKKKKKKVRYNLVRCGMCNSIIGADLTVKLVERCIRCHRGQAAGSIKPRAFSNLNKGPAKDLPPKYRDYQFRSGWEKNIARVLTITGVNWEFETERCEFFFPGYKRGPKKYLIDFYLPDRDVYYEVKGRFMARDKTKITRLEKLYPETLSKLIIIVSQRNKKAINFYKSHNVPIEYYEDYIDKWKTKIPAWDK